MTTAAATSTAGSQLRAAVALQRQLGLHLLQRLGSFLSQIQGIAVVDSVSEEIICTAIDGLNPDPCQLCGVNQDCSPAATQLGRLLGSTGSLTGYAGGISRKQWLLSLEGVEQTRLLTGSLCCFSLSPSVWPRKCRVYICPPTRQVMP